MGEMTTDQLARNIVQRANSLDISIAKLCRDAGVNRRWFERFKQRTPASVDAYIKIESQLLQLEREQEAQDRVSFTCPRTMRKRTGIVKHHNGADYIFCPDSNDTYPLKSVLNINYLK